jgi:hypothetical protein
MTCHLIKTEPLESPVIKVAYVSVMEDTSDPMKGRTDTFLPRFVNTYNANPAGWDHELVIICQGGMKPRFKQHTDRVNGTIWNHPNDAGWDISAFCDLAHSVKDDCDLLMCLGESCYFHRPGWLERIARAWQQHGAGIYGVAGSHNPIGHIITSAFACTPLFLTRYPRVTNNSERYAFEHGKHALWRRIVASGLPAMVVAWDGVYPPGRWREPNNTLQRGDQSNCLIWFNHVERWFSSYDDKTKARLAALTDSPYR